MRARYSRFSARNGVRQNDDGRDGVAVYHLKGGFGSRAGGQSARAKDEYIEREGRYAADSRAKPGAERDADRRQVERFEREIAGVGARLKETYDRVRTALDRRIQQAGRAIRAGAESAHRVGEYTRRARREIDQQLARR